MPTFVLSDGNVINCYGFRVRTAGINFSRFDLNPVMLAEHVNSIAALLGKWINRQVNGAILTAEPDFDTEDEDAAKVKGKVDRGFLKGASIGFTYDYSKMELMPDGVWELVECELVEASICAVPGNKNAIRLYAADTGKLLTESEVKLSIEGLQPGSHNPKISEMKKLQLSIAALAALGFNEQPNEDAVATLSAAIENLQKKYEAEKTAREALQNKVQAQQKLQAEELVNKAISEGRISPIEGQTVEQLKGKFVDMAVTDYSLAQAVLATMPPKVSLSNQVDNPAIAGGDIKTADDFEKLPDDKKIAYKQQHPESYKKLFA